MAQVGWVWLDNKGGKYRVGIYHGEQSGHVVIHCNLRVIQIDFAVKESRTYTFFIDEELCEVRIEKHKDGHFTYDFQINKTANTPRNQIRKADDRQIRRNLGWFVAGLIAFLVLIFVALKYYGAQQRVKKQTQLSWISGVNEKNVTRLSLEGKEAVAQLTLTGDAPHQQMVYRFTTHTGQVLSDSVPVENPGAVLLPNGFPLQNNDAFTLRYLPADPHVHRLDFAQPVRNTMEAYMARATVAEQQQHPQQTPEQSACVARMVLEMKGWTGLAFVINQGLSETQHPRYNQNAYLRLVRSPEMRNMIQHHCLIIK